MCRRVEVDSVCCVSVRSALAPATHTMGSRSKKRKKKRSGSRFTMTCHPRQPSVTRRMVVSSVIIALAHTRGAHSTARHTQLTYRKSPALLYLTEWLVSPRRYPTTLSRLSFTFSLAWFPPPTRIKNFSLLRTNRQNENGARMKPIDFDRNRHLLLYHNFFSHIYIPACPSSLFRSLSSARRIAIGNDWDLSGRGAEQSHFSLPGFRDVHLGNGRWEEEGEASELRSSLSIRFGWVREGNGNDHLSGRYSPFSVSSSSCPSGWHGKNQKKTGERRWRKANEKYREAAKQKGNQIYSRGSLGRLLTTTTSTTV